MSGNERPTCPDFVPDFGELHHETEWSYRSCERYHESAEPHYLPGHNCVGWLANLDQDFSAATELAERYCSQPVIVGTYVTAESVWRSETEPADEFKCDHLRAGPRPAFRWAEYPGWQNCHACHWDLIVGMGLSTGGFRCKRCRCQLNSDKLRLRALIHSDLLMAAVCDYCARLFDRAEPRAADAPAPGTAFYAARTAERSSPEEFARELRAAGFIPEPKEGDG